MTKKYDLHCHSTASDGVLTPTALVQRAHEQGINVLALCDHDTVIGIDEAKLEADKLGIELINGVEISTNWEGRGIHIVGLNFDKTHPKMTALLAMNLCLRVGQCILSVVLFCIRKPRKNLSIVIKLPMRCISPLRQIL